MRKTTTLPELKHLAESLARQIKTEKDLGELTRLLRKTTIEAALGVELEDHLGYARHLPSGHHSGNSRNGCSRKTLKGDHGEVAIAVPRDCNGSFEPRFVRKGQSMPLPNAGMANTLRSVPPGASTGRISLPYSIIRTTFAR